MKKTLVSLSVVLCCVISLTIIILHQNSKIIYIPDYKKAHYNTGVVEISDEELNLYIRKILGNFYTVEATNRVTIQNGDVVNINYKRFESGICVNDIEDLNVLIGSGGFHSSIENFLIGKEINATYDYRDDFGTLYQITINEIGNWIAPELTNDFLQKNFQVDNLEAFNFLMYQKLFSSKELAQTTNIKNQIISDLKDETIFIIVSEDVDDFYSQIIDNERAYAEMLGISFEFYISDVKKMTIEEFTNHCYQMAEDALKEMLICEKIWNNMKEEELEKYLTKFDIKSTSSISDSLKLTIVKSYLYDLNLESE